MTTKGVLTFAYGAGYQRMAYAQALSLKGSVPITVGVPSLEYPDLAQVANVVIVPDRFKPFEWHMQALRISPYNVTVMTDADVLWPAGIPIHSYFGAVSRLSLVSGSANDLNSSAVDCTWYRHTELALHWPTFYCAVMGFDKTNNTSLEFFDRAQYLFDNWWKLRSLIGNLPRTTDSIFSAVYHEMFKVDKIPGGLGLPFSHAKQGVCGQAFHDSWATEVPAHIDLEGTLVLAGHPIGLPLHYFDKSFLTDTLLTRLKECSTATTTKTLP